MPGHVHGDWWLTRTVVGYGLDWPQFAAPRKKMNRYDYDHDFVGAFRRTEDFGLSAPAMPNLAAGRLFGRQQDERLVAILRSALGGLSPHDLMAQCFAIHYALAPMIDSAYEVRSVLTLGWVHTPPNDHFRMSDEELIAVMRDGVSGGKLNLHCWLTLPTREILDCTLPTTIAFVNEMPEAYEGAVLSKHWTELTGGVRYHPQLVGSDFLERSGALVHF